MEAESRESKKGNLFFFLRKHLEERERNVPEPPLSGVTSPGAQKPPPPGTQGSADLFSPSPAGVTGCSHVTFRFAHNRRWEGSFGT